MSLMEKIKNLFRNIHSYFAGKSTEKESTEILLEDSSQIVEELALIDDEEKISAAKRSLMTELYMLEQEIIVFEKSFPDEYKTFKQRIETLRELYNSNLEELKKALTFEIDPELDSTKTGEILKLEREINRFIEKEVKFDIISKRLQRLIRKLNILYNVSIFHFKDSDKTKARAQVERAFDNEMEIIKELKKCDYILNDIRLKERIISLISYTDYQIFKVAMRNSNVNPEDLIKALAILVEFDGFDYTNSFKAFIQDEISDLSGLLSYINEEEYRTLLEKKLNSLLTSIAYASDLNDRLKDTNFWKEFFNFESQLFEMLKLSGVEKEKIKVKLIDTMDIAVDEKDVLVLPKTNAYLSLINLYSVTHDKRILLVIEILKNLSDDIKYRDLYFLLVLFDVIEVVKNTPNELIGHVEKYLNEYPYDRSTISEKKNSLINSSNKEYVIIFTLNDSKRELITILRNLSIDFKVEDDKVFINAFYFNGLENVLNTLRINTQNMEVTK